MVGFNFQWWSSRGRNEIPMQALFHVPTLIERWVGWTAQIFTLDIAVLPTASPPKFHNQQQHAEGCGQAFYRSLVGTLPFVCSWFPIVSRVANTGRNSFVPLLFWAGSPKESQDWSSGVPSQVRRDGILKSQTPLRQCLTVGIHCVVRLVIRPLIKTTTIYGVLH